MKEIIKRLAKLEGSQGAHPSARRWKRVIISAEGEDSPEAIAAHLRSEDVSEDDCMIIRLVRPSFPKSEAFT